MRRQIRAGHWWGQFVLWTGMASLLLTGCVERRFLVTTDPPGAIVQVNGKTVGATPVDVPYTYYGTYRLTLLRDGYETLVVDQPICAPWYEYPPLDFVSENLIPWTMRDLRRFHFQMVPLAVVPPEAVLDRSEQMRGRGRTIGVPPTEAGPLAVPPPPIPGQPLPVPAPPGLGAPIPPGEMVPGQP